MFPVSNNSLLQFTHFINATKMWDYYKKKHSKTM